MSFEVFHALPTVVLFSGRRERTKRSPPGMGDTEVTGSVEMVREKGAREGKGVNMENLWNDKRTGGTGNKEGRGRATRSRNNKTNNVRHEENYVSAL